MAAQRKKIDRVRTKLPETSTLNIISTKLIYTPGDNLVGHQVTTQKNCNIIYYFNTGTTKYIFNFKCFTPVFLGSKNMKIEENRII